MRRGRKNPPFPNETGNPDLKFCYGCNQWLDRVLFGFDKSRKDGLGFRCKDCDNDRNRKRIERNRENIIIPEIKLCICCNEEKTKDNFKSDTTRKDGLCPYCKDCLKEKWVTHYEKYRQEYIDRSHKWYSIEENKLRATEYAKIYVENNKELVALRRKIYYQENKEKIAERARKYINLNPHIRKKCQRNYRNRKFNAEGEHSQYEWDALCTLFNNTCLCCGSKEKMTEDHIIPLSCGGTDYIKNIQPLCFDCNRFKWISDYDYRIVTEIFILTKMYIEGE